jgi:hypothetical protein
MQVKTRANIEKLPHSHSDGGGDAVVEEELLQLKRRMDALEKENMLLKEGGITARAGGGGLTARAVVTPPNNKSGSAKGPNRPVPALPGGGAPSATRRQSRSSGESGTDSDVTSRAEVAEVVSEAGGGSHAGVEAGKLRGIDKRHVLPVPEACAVFERLEEAAKQGGAARRASALGGETGAPYPCFTGTKSTNTDT